MKTTSFDLEPNPFERSFAPEKDEYKNKPDLRIPNISHLNLPDGNKIPGITPAAYTPGGRKLPPLSLSPGGILAPDTPGSNLWNSLLNVTGLHPNGLLKLGTTPTAAQNLQQQYHQPPQLLHPPIPQASSLPPNPMPGQVVGPDSQYGGQNFNQFVNTIRKTGLTPNESNLRSGLTPGGAGGFPFGNLPGLTTPSGLLNSPMTPGLSSLLGMTLNQVAINMNASQIPQKPQPHAPPPQQQAPYPPSLQISHQRHASQQQEVHPQLQRQQQRQSQPPQPSQQPPQHLPQDNDVRQHHQKQPPQSSLQQDMQQPASMRFNAVEGKKRKSSTDKGNSKEPRVSPKASTGGRKKRKNDIVKPEKQSSPTHIKSSLSDHTEGEEKVDDDEEVNGTEEEKRKTFLERNRVAASKCRQRKKQQLQKMEDELSFYSTGYREVSVQVTQLRNHLLTLRNILNGHKECPTFVNSVGGFENMSNIIQQTDYLCQISGQSANASSIPSTIPTTLNTTAAKDVNSGYEGNPTPSSNNSTMSVQVMPQQHQQQPHPAQAPQLQPPHQGQHQQSHGPMVGPPVHGNMVMHASNASPANDSSSAVSAETINAPAVNYATTAEMAVHQPLLQAHRHSLTDLPSTAASEGASVVPNEESSFLRTINSMSNIADANQRGLMPDSSVQVGTQEFAVRQAASMVNLQGGNAAVRLEWATNPT